MFLKKKNKTVEETQNGHQLKGGEIKIDSIVGALDELNELSAWEKHKRDVLSVYWGSHAESSEQGQTQDTKQAAKAAVSRCGCF
jgi:hypothetical protein